MEKPDQLIEYVSGKTTIKGNSRNKFVQQTIATEQRIKWAWIIIAAVAIFFTHSVAPAVVLKIREWFT